MPPKGTSANPAGKPIGARMKQVTKARRILDRAAKMNDAQKAVFDIDITEEGLTELDAIYLVQLEKAKFGDKDAFKACMDYSGYKPIEKLELESKEVEEFTTVEEVNEERNKLLEEIAERMANEKIKAMGIELPKGKE